MSRISKTTIGAVEVIALTDGDMVFPDTVFPDTPPDEIAAHLAAANAEALATQFNAFAIRSGPDLLLVDTGAAGRFGPTAGFLHDALSEAGIAPADITHIFLTHMHGDHAAGAVDGNGDAVFPNAQLMLSQTEHDFWVDQTFTAEHVQKTQTLSKRVFAAYSDGLQLLNGEADIVGGVSMLPLPGHTPGHAGFRVSDGSEQLIGITDIMHVQAVQLADPNACVMYDIDKEQAKQTRKTTLDMLATDGLAYTGGHVLDQKFARLERAGTGYHMRPA